MLIAFFEECFKICNSTTYDKGVSPEGGQLTVEKFGTYDNGLTCFI
jgi:hypothetical protein